MNKLYRDDFAGMQFGMWSVLRFSHKKGPTTYWWCKCECGEEKAVVAQSLKNGKSTSCGHWKKEFLGKRATHGKHGSRLYKVWAQMIQRCTNPNHKSYRNYGGRGIGVSAEWRDFSAFEVDMADGWKPGLTIERKDNDQGYSKGNCCWATRTAQIHNRRPRDQWSTP